MGAMAQDDLRLIVVPIVDDVRENVQVGTRRVAAGEQVALDEGNARAERRAGQALASLCDHAGQVEDSARAARRTRQDR